MELIDIEKLKTFLASKVTMMTDYDNGICESCIDEYIDEFIAGQQTDIQCEDAVSRKAAIRACGGYMVPANIIKHLPSIQPAQHIDADGTLWITVTDIEQVKRVIVDEEKSKFCRQFYMDAQPEQRTDLLKAEIKRMKRSFTICINRDYYTGYMSALSAVEGFIAQLEGKE